MALKKNKAKKSAAPKKKAKPAAKKAVKKAPKPAKKVATKKIAKKAAAKPVSKKKAASKPAKKAVAKKAVIKKTVKKAVKKAAPKAAKKAVAKKPIKKAAPARKSTPAKKAPVVATTKEALKPQTKKKLTEREKSFLGIRHSLVSQREALLSEAGNAINNLPEQTVFPDLGDQASAETDRNFMLRLRGREQRLINKIEETIERIDSGNYGKCEACGEDITIERLQARPVATLCIDCKTEQEEEEKLQGQ